MDESITIIYNVRLDSEYRVNRFCKSIELLENIDGLHFSVRIRGLQANTAEIWLKNLVKRKILKNFVIMSGSTYNNWKLDCLEQIFRSKSQTYILAQEDHFLIADVENFRSAIVDFQETKSDYLALSFFRNYSEFVHSTQWTAQGTTKNLRYWDVSKASWQNLMPEKKMYLVNLLGAFTYDFLYKILVSEKPFIKYFDVNHPYDFEQRPSENWYLAMRFAIPNFEIFACVDDNHGYDGTSLISRGIVDKDTTRVIEHHEYSNPFNFKNKLGVRIFEFIFMKFLLKFLNVNLNYEYRVMVFKYSLVGLVSRPKRYYQRKSLKKKFKL